MKALALLIAFAAAASVFACNDPELTQCTGGDAGPTPTCEVVCAHLFELTCRVGTSVEQCTTICAGSGATTDFPAALRCYQAAGSCDGVNACSRGCGPDASVVPFVPVFLGVDAADEQDGGQ
jgi:hypothetical protein